jgi:hypothetical protein
LAELTFARFYQACNKMSFVFARAMSDFGLILDLNAKAQLVQHVLPRCRSRQMKGQLAIQVVPFFNLHDITLP